MNPFEMVVMIVFISVIGGVFTTYFKSKNGGSGWDWDFDLDDLWDDDDDDDGYKRSQKKIARQQQQLVKQVEIKYEQKIATLEERIKVLEAIVTDEKYQLKKEIEKLNV